MNFKEFSPQAKRTTMISVVKIKNRKFSLNIFSPKENDLSATDHQLFEKSADDLKRRKIFSPSGFPRQKKTSFFFFSINPHYSYPNEKFPFKRIFLFFSKNL